MVDGIVGGAEPYKLAHCEKDDLVEELEDVSSRLMDGLDIISRYTNSMIFFSALARSLRVSIALNALNASRPDVGFRLIC